MQFYTQTLDDIPKEFLLNQKKHNEANTQGSGVPPKTEDLMFILAMLLFLQDEPLFTESD